MDSSLHKRWQFAGQPLVKHLADELGQRRGCAAGGDGDLDRPVLADRGHEEVAVVGIVGGIDQHPDPSGGVGDPGIYSWLVGAGEDKERSGQVLRLEALPQHLNCRLRIAG
jgi:hypothetical protein